MLKEIAFKNGNFPRIENIREDIRKRAKKQKAKDDQRNMSRPQIGMRNHDEFQNQNEGDQKGLVDFNERRQIVWFYFEIESI